MSERQHDYEPQDSNEFSSSFRFQPRSAKLEVREIARINVDQIINSGDVTVLQKYLKNITFGKLTEKDMIHVSDRAFSNLFRISQLTIEYLLYTQETMQELLEQQGNQEKEQSGENEALRSQLQAQTKKIQGDRAQAY